MTERQRSQHAAGMRAALAVVPPRTRESETVTILRDAATTFATMAADAERFTRAMKCRQLADDVRALELKIETDTRVDATKLRAFAIHLENRAGMLEGKPL